ncbi:MAG: hypothetical protein ACFUZC_16515 [Chthoniobacteraceae bacterium]
MFLVTGDTYDIREQLKEMGCKWDADAGAWAASDEATRALGQALADDEPYRKWREFLGSLAWAQGSFTDTAFQAGLNACSRGIPVREAVEEVRSRIHAAGKTPEAGWVERNVGRAYDYAEPPKDRRGGRVARPGGGVAEGEAPKEKPKPQFDPQKLHAFAARPGVVIDTAWLADRSPVDPAMVGPVEFLRALYKPEESVVILDVFKSQGQWLYSAQRGIEPSCVDFAAWKEKDPFHTAPPLLMPGRPFDAAGPQGIWYLCNPVDGKFRVMDGVDMRQLPKWSRRWEPCVTDWRYFVFESDEADARDWIGAIAQLPMRIAAIYTSGGKSIHVLVRVDARSKVEFDQWRESAKRTMIPLGADKQCMSAVRLTRLPGCLRLQDKHGRAYPRPHLQKLLYLAPDAEKGALIERRPLRDSFGPWQRWAEGMLASDRDEVDDEDFARLVRGLNGFHGPRSKHLLEELERWM